MLYGLQQRLVETPEQLALFAYREVSFLQDQLSSNWPILRQWQASCIACGPQQRGTTSGATITNSNFSAHEIRDGGIDETGFARRNMRDRGPLNVPDDFDTRFPDAQAKLLA